MNLIVWTFISVPNSCNTNSVGRITRTGPSNARFFYAQRHITDTKKPARGWLIRKIGCGGRIRTGAPNPTTVCSSVNYKHKKTSSRLVNSENWLRGPDSNGGAQPDDRLLVGKLQAQKNQLAAG
ncbi:hypothetical protein ACFOMG_05195 [Bacterioplanoides pacificum]|uniref:Uncharacterized protein n=1 Tax=Bacterioplanoides pacificum TaxID=1171596 RepID=A0ABV7VRX6_9GAMM